MARFRVLITVKTYPQPSRRYGEIVCTAGVREGGGLIRLYPIAFRQLPYDQQYRKYQWIEIDAEKNPRDPRPESHRCDIASIVTVGEPLGTDDDWTERRRLVLPEAAQSMEELQERRQADGTSLGLVRPAAVTGLDVEPAEPRDWTPRQAAVLQQGNLFGPDLAPLRKIPYTFRYGFRCDDPRCRGHRTMIEDWELGALYLRMVAEHGDEQVAIRRVREKFLDELCGRTKDTHFFVGNTLEYQNAWLVLGVFWPPRTLQPTLDFA